MGKPKLELRRVSKIFDNRMIAVDRVDLLVEEGQTVALLGPSGCGKSTTLNMIVGLSEPTEGDILIDGKSVLNVPPGERPIGLVFQDYAVFTHMTVYDNLAFGLRVRKLSRVEVDRKVRDVAELLELTGLLKTKARHLGGSEHQRVAIGRTLVTEPSILLLDEPLSNLEVTLRNRVRQQLRQIQERTRQTIIYVTHDQIEALSLAHKIAVMSEGRVRQYDTSHNVYHRCAHRFVGSFLGSPPMNFFEGTISRNGRVSLNMVASKLPLPNGSVTGHLTEGRMVTLGVRPEAMTLADASDPLSFEAQVVLVQPRGPEKVLTLIAGGALFKMVVPAQVQVVEDQAVHVAGRPEHLVFFDQLSGYRIDPAEVHA